MFEYIVKVYLKSGQTMDLVCYSEYVYIYQQVVTALTNGSDYVKIDSPGIPLYACIKTSDISGVAIERKNNGGSN